MPIPPHTLPLSPYTTLFRSDHDRRGSTRPSEGRALHHVPISPVSELVGHDQTHVARPGSGQQRDRKSTRLNSSHVSTSYAVFSLKKKNSSSRTAPAAS